MSVIEAERLSEVDRRRWARARVRLPVRVVDTEDSFRVLVGETLDVCVGGMRAVIDGALFGTVEVTVQMELVDDAPLVCQALVADGGAVDGGWEYRLAFRNLADREVAALAHLVEHAGQVPARDATCG